MSRNDNLASCVCLMDWCVGPRIFSTVLATTALSNLIRAHGFAVPRSVPYGAVWVDSAATGQGTWLHPARCLGSTAPTAARPGEV